MAGSKVRYTDDVPADIAIRLRERCLAFTRCLRGTGMGGDAVEGPYAHLSHVLGIDLESGPLIVLAFRSSGEESETLRHAGHPFFVLGWGRDAIGMVLDADTDWDEVRELVTDGFCVLAPKKLVALVNRPDPGRT